MENTCTLTWYLISKKHVESAKPSYSKLQLKSQRKEEAISQWIAAIKQCSKRGNIEEGKTLHTHAVEGGYQTNKYIATALVNMYSKCGSMPDARSVFDNMVHRDVVLWTSLILGYVKNRESQEAMDLFTRMDCEPTSFTFVAALKACVGLATDEKLCLEKGISIHRQAKERGLETNIYVGSSLVDMYSKCGSMLHAFQVFDTMTYRDVVLWNTLMFGYVESGESSVAIELFKSMNCQPDAFTFVAAVRACASLASGKEFARHICLDMGKAIHRQARDRGFHADIFVANSLIDMYSKCGSMQDAQSVFDSLAHRDVFSWNILMLGYVDNEQRLVALDLFMKIDQKPNSVTFIAAVKACTACSCLETGLTIHAQVKEYGFHTDVFVANSLMEMYSKFSSMERARDVFNHMVHRNVLSWNILIMAYVEHGQSVVAEELFMSMDCQPDSFTFVAVLKAYTALAGERNSNRQFYLERAVAIHNQVKERGLDADIFVATGLVDLYSKCGSIDHARDVFNNMLLRDIVSWNILILGYVEHGLSLLAMDLFVNMDCEPDSFTFVAVLKGCGSIGDLAAGRAIHTQVCKLGLEQVHVVANCLLDFYGKCGSMAGAEQVFTSMHSQDIVSWTALIAGYSSNGETYEVFSLVKRMQQAGSQMDEVTSSLILTACSHAGMVEEGKKYFESMSTYGVNPTIEHYHCMVDMLGRANRVEEALALVNRMPFEAGYVTWITLLGACKKLNNLEVGKVAFDALMACNKKDSAAYVLMGDIYMELGMVQDWEELEMKRTALSDDTHVHTTVNV